MKNFIRLLLVSMLALSSTAFAQTYVGPVQTLPPGCNSTNYLRGDNTCATPAGSGGTVSSVGLSTPSWLTVAGSPITGSGTLAVTATSGQTANSFLATPNGSAGAVSLRTITLTDLPATIAANTTGNAATATALATNPTDCSANQYADAIDAGGNLTCAQVAAAQVTGLATSATIDTTNASNIASGTLSSARLPATIAANTTGNSATATALAANPTDCSANQYASAIDASGNLTCAQVAAAQVTGLATSATTDTTNATNITSGTLGAPQGGTGQATITLGDLLYGSASNVLSKLGGNTTTSKRFLTQTGDGVNSAAPAWNAIVAADLPSLGANPTATSGTAAVNGTATTYMTSDSAPAINLGMSPTWTGTHIFANKVQSNAGFIATQSTTPFFTWIRSSAGTDLKQWAAYDSAGVWTLATQTDAGGTGKNILTATRGTTTAITNVSLGNASDNNTYTFLGTGSITVGGSILGQATVFSNVLVNGSVPGGAGIYRPSSGVLGFACSTGVACGQIDGNKLLTLQSGIVSGGTKFTAAGTGCTVGTTTGGATAGTFTLAAGPCTSVAITMNGATGATATNGWTCHAHDRTAPTVLIGGESSSTTTTASITIPAGAGATDVISFSCTGF